MALVPDETKTTKLECYYTDAEEREVKHTYKHAKATATAEQVKALMTAEITYARIYNDEPNKIVGAQFVMTETKPIELPA